MAARFTLVSWTPFKRAYDLVLGLGLFLFFAAYLTATFLAAPEGQRPSEIQVVIRASGAAAFSLLTIILCLGPLARLTRAALPLVYNRRHLGVVCFLVALVHGALVVLWYHGFSTVNPFVSLLTSNADYAAFGGFPFESLGLIALLILFVMAATSHDFWNGLLGPRMWKTLHMGVYAAYGLLVGHVMLGAALGTKGIAQAGLVAVSAALVSGLHIAAGLRERARERQVAAETEGWLDAGAAEDIPDGRAVILVPPAGERIAVFRDGAQVFAVANACRHQGGPLGEGRIIGGCIVCPWHGFQYRPGDGCSPPPYTEKIPTYRTRIIEGRVLVEPVAQAPGTAMAPSRIGEGGLMAEEPFFVGWSDELAKPTRRQMLGAGLGLAVGAGALGAGLGAMAPPPGPGVWDQGRKIAVTGTIYPEPYLHLLTRDLGEGVRPVFLVGPDKTRVTVRPALTFTGAAVTGTLIERGEHAMMAVEGVYADPAPGRVRPGTEKDFGAVLLAGEILDAKCWFGAMRPGHGKTHKACAALCAKGGLPLAFAELERCAEGKAGFLFLNERGLAFGPEIIPLVAEPVAVRGRIVEVAGLRQVRVRLADVVRL